MLRFLASAALFAVALSTPAFAASIEGRLMSIDAGARTLILETGVIFNVTEYVTFDGLEPGQLLRVTYTDETADATAIDILEYNQPAVPTDDASVDTTDEPAAEITPDPIDADTAE